MTLISGASGFVNAATLANSRGQTPATNNVLLSGGSTADLLEAGRRNGAPGIGLSSRARALTKQLLNNTAGLGNALLSSAAESNTTENLQTQILAIRSSLPESSLSRGLTGEEVSAATQSENPFFEATSANGDIIDTTA